MQPEQFAPEFEGLGLSQEDRNLVSPFFTNLDSSVYAIANLPPEVVGALCSRASRAKDDLRLVLLNEYIKPFLTVNEVEITEKMTMAGKQSSDISGEIIKLNHNAQSLTALIDFLHQHPETFASSKAREFYIKWLAQFGDDSIAQMAGTHLGYAGISQLAIKQIEDMRLGIAPIEKSTRYVDYSSKVNGKYRYYTDPTLADMGLLAEYTAAMDSLFDVYTAILNEYSEFLRKKYPGEEERVIKTKAFDTARLLLPVATLSQVAFFANGQAFEYMINRGLDHLLGEIRWSSEQALYELSKVIPAFLHRLREENSREYRSYLMGRDKGIQEAMENLGFPTTNGEQNQQLVKLLEYDPEGEDKIIAGLVYPKTHESFDVVLGRVKQLSLDAKADLLQKVLRNRKFKYYKLPRAFENVYLRWEILMNIGAWRDLHRHRTQTQMRQRFTITHGFDVPEGLIEAGLDGKYRVAIQGAEEVFAKIEAKDPDLAQYCCVLGHRVRFMQYQNPRAFFWEAELRTTSQGHPDYRRIEQEKARQFQTIYPLIGKYLLVDMNDYDFARRGDTKKISAKEEDLLKKFVTPST